LPSGELRDAAIVAAALRLEHYEMAAYSSARLLSRRLNRADETRLLQETLDEETRAVRRLISIADAAPVEALPPEAVPAMPVATNATPPHGDKLR
jgi:ferritin-like metal-binding protein YciE